MGFKSNKRKSKHVVKPLEVVSADGQKKADVAKDPTLLPNTFKFAADSLKIMSERGGSVGSIVVKNYKSYNYKLIYALVMNTVKNIKIIKKIIHNLKLMNSTKESNPFLVEIMVGDLLFGRGLSTVEKNQLAIAIKSRKDAIVKEQSELKSEYLNDADEEIAKYLRVNHLKGDSSYVISQLKSAGLTQVEYSKDKIKFKKFISKFKSMEDNQFMLDFHFPNDLIVLKTAAAKRLNKTDLLKSNKASFQDKASFMAVEAMNVKPQQNIIDACFAPGGKTAVIASKMKNKGKILAYDMNKSRLVSAIRFLKLQGISNAKYECQDFSLVKLKRLPKIHKIELFDSILIDPSCSGSGIGSRVDYKKSDVEVGRLKKLRAFQVMLLKKALMARVSKSIVYCTCSTSLEENEQVVEMSLNESGVKDKWQVESVLPYWPHRGDSSSEYGEKFLRSGPDALTNGFFIAKLSCLEPDTKGEDLERPLKKPRLAENNKSKQSKKLDQMDEADDDDDDDEEEEDDDEGNVDDEQDDEEADSALDDEDLDDQEDDDGEQDDEEDDEDEEEFEDATDASD